MTAIPPGLLKDPVVFLATGFGSGLSPYAPGTIGTLVSLILFAVLKDTTWVLLALCVIGFVAGIYLCGYTARKLGTHDHGGIVWDEFIGMWITLLWIPVSPLALLLGFVLFRLFDILKPWPIGFLDKRVQGGFGIMLDDVLAGLFANLSLLLILRYIV